MESDAGRNVGHESVEGSVDACSNLLCGRALERMKGNHIVAFLGKLGVEARRTRGAVEDLAEEVARRQGEHPDVFVLRSPLGNDLVQLRDGALLAAVGRECFIEAADLTGSPVRMDYAFARGLVVFPLGLVPDTAGLFFVPRLDGPVEVL